MRFGLIHRLMTDALAGLGLLSLLTSGELDLRITQGALALLAIALLLPERWQHHHRTRTLGVVGSLALLAIELLRLFLGLPVLTVAVEFAVGLQLIRLLTRRGAAHDQQIVLLALLHLVAGTVLGGGLAYGLCFLGFLVIAPGALVLSHLRREVEGNYRQGARDRTGLPVDVPRILRSRRVISPKFLMGTCSLALPIFLFTAVLFVIFPRVGLSLLLLDRDRSERMVGFSDKVDLGNVGRLRADATIAARVYLPDLPEKPPARVPLYLRGTAFSAYDGNSWSRDGTQQEANRSENRIWLQPSRTPIGEELMTVDLEPIKPPVIFLPGDAVAFDIHTSGNKLLREPPQVSFGREGEFEYATREDQGLRYTVFRAWEGAQPFERLTEKTRRRYLQVPKQLTESLRALGTRWANGAVAPLAIAQRVEQQLRTQFTYDLDSPSGGATDPVRHFLFESKRGHCEFYSTSMALILRSLNIPTRNVTGFIGGTFNRFGGFYAVRQGDAHSWVEVYLSDSGWMRFDPTPAAEAAPRAKVDGLIATMRDLMEAAAERWDRNIIGYDLKQQASLLQRARQQVNFSSAKFPRLTGVGRGFGAGAIAAMLLAGLGYWYWRRQRGMKKNPPPSEQAQLTSQVIGLYQALESILRHHGVPRRTDTPPLAHAYGLRALKHPIAEDVVYLTQVYIDVRFGGAKLTPQSLEDYQDALKRLKRQESIRNDAA